MARLRFSVGSTLASALIGTALVSITLLGGTALYRQYLTGQFAANRAAEIGAALKATDGYARKHETALLNGQAVAGFVDSLNPTVQELVYAGLLPAGFSETGGNGGALKVVLRTEPTGCVGAKCQLLIAVYPTGSILNQYGQADSALAAKIALAIPDGSGWTNLASDNRWLSKNSFATPNPLGSLPAVVVAQAWLGSNQPSATVPPVSYETNAVADCSYGGTTTYQRSVTTDKWGAVTYGSWVYLTDSCAPPPPPPPPPTCPNNASDYPTCTPPVVTPPPSPPVCPNGALDFPVCTQPATGSPPPTGCTYSTTSETSVCTGGMVGSITTTYQVNSCTNAKSQTGQSSSCACPSGTTWDGGQCSTTSTQTTQPASCPVDVYLDQIWKVASNGYMYRRYAVTYGPPPSCVKTSTNMGEGDGDCTTPGCPM